MDLFQFYTRRAILGHCLWPRCLFVLLIYNCFILFICLKSWLSDPEGLCTQGRLDAALLVNLRVHAGPAENTHVCSWHPLVGGLAHIHRKARQPNLDSSACFTQLCNVSESWQRAFNNQIALKRYVIARFDHLLLYIYCNTNLDCRIKICEICVFFLSSPLSGIGEKRHGLCVLLLP